MKRNDVISVINGTNVDKLKHDAVLKLLKENPKMASLRVIRSRDDSSSSLKRPLETSNHPSPKYLKTNTSDSVKQDAIINENLNLTTKKETLTMHDPCEHQKAGSKMLSINDKIGKNTE